MGFNVLLQDNIVGVPFVADETLVEHAHGGSDPVYAHVRFEVSFGGEASLAHLAFIWPLSRVDSVMHLQG